MTDIIVEGESMAVDVIVVNYHTPTDLTRFGLSLSGQDVGTLSIVNNEVEGLDIDASMGLMEALSPDMPVRIVNHKTNLGYAKAVNDAATWGENPYLAIFNADVECLPGSIAAVVEFMHENREVGIAGPRQVNSAGLITHAGIFGTRDKPKLRGWKQPDVGQYSENRLDAVSVSGSAYFVRRTCWDALTKCGQFQDAVKGVIGCSAEGAFLPTMHYY